MVLKKEKTDSVNNMDATQQADLVVEKLTECQSRLFAFIYSLTADSNLAWDTLQETNRVLWKKADEYDTNRDFMPWAMTHAYNQVRTARKKNQRERLIFQDQSTLRQIADDWLETEPTKTGPRMIALESCLDSLGSHQRNLIDRFYSDGVTIAQLAVEQGSRENSIAVKLHRIRQKLADCINKRLLEK